MRQYSRRSLLGFVLAAALGGCIGSGEDGEEGTTPTDDQPTTTEDEQEGGSEPTQTTGTDREKDTATPTPETEDRVDEVPDGVALVNPLPDLVEADDRDAFATDQDLAFRDGTVKVEIELTENGERPDQYIAEVVDEYAQIVVAFVDVDDLVALATDDNVHFVRTYSEPATPSS